MLYNLKKDKALIGHNFYIVSEINNSFHDHSKKYLFAAPYKLIGFNKCQKGGGRYAVAVFEKVESKPFFSIDFESNKYKTEIYSLVVPGLSEHLSAFIKSHKILKKNGFYSLKNINEYFPSVLMIKIYNSDVRQLNSNIIDIPGPYTICTNRKTVFNIFNSVFEDEIQTLFKNFNSIYDNVEYDVENNEISINQFREKIEELKKIAVSVLELNPKKYNELKCKIGYISELYKNNLTAYIENYDF